MKSYMDQTGQCSASSASTELAHNLARVEPPVSSHCSKFLFGTAKSSERPFTHVQFLETPFTRVH